MLIIPSCDNLQHKFMNECDHAFHFHLDLNKKNKRMKKIVEKLKKLHNLPLLKLYLNPLLHNKILDWSKLKAVAGDNF